MSSPTRVVVTCGPAHAPVDAVRRLTNVSTGELGTLLSEALVKAGCEVICFRGEMATHRTPDGASVIPFSTNASLREALEKLSEKPAVIFHAAALCDFEVAEVRGAAEAKKIRSDVAELQIILRPSEKVLPKLRALFPEAKIVGWKYELDGTTKEALARASAQIAGAKVDACVVNGSAYGTGLGFLDAQGGPVKHFVSKTALCEFLVTYAVVPG